MELKQFTYETLFFICEMACWVFVSGALAASNHNSVQDIYLVNLSINTSAQHKTLKWNPINGIISTGH